MKKEQHQPFHVMIAAREALESEYDEIADWINACPKNAMGLTLDSVKATDDWKCQFNKAKKLRDAIGNINKVLTKHYKKELKDYAFNLRMKKRKIKESGAVC